MGDENAHTRPSEGNPILRRDSSKNAGTLLDNHLNLVDAIADLGGQPGT